MFREIKDPILATSVYVDGRFVAKNVKVQIPGAERKTTTYDNLGVEVPLSGLFDAARAKITYIGIDKGLSYFASDGKTHTYEFRFCENVISAGGKTRRAGGTVFINGAGAGVPAIDIAPGESTETDIEILVYSQKLEVDGEVIYDIDRTGGTAIIGGRNELSDIEGYL